jgi:hypothetical protein
MSTETKKKVMAGIDLLLDFILTDKIIYEKDQGTIFGRPFV